jgi:flagellar hook-length control protein FliK
MIVTRPITTNYGSLERNTSMQQSRGALKPGNIVDAVVISNSNHGQVRLRIGNAILTASTSTALHQKAHLLLEVVQTHPQLLLRMIPSTSDTTSSKALRDAMFSHLSRQSGLAPSLAGLINRALAEGNNTESTRLRGFVNSLDKAIPGRSNLTQAEGMRQAMLHSGIFLEALLARSARNRKAYTSRDLKACLLRLQNTLEQHKHRPGLDKSLNNIPISNLNDSATLPKSKGLPVPQQRVAVQQRFNNSDSSEYIPELLSRTKAAIARLGYLQVVSAENFNNGEYMWQLEIPVKHTDAIEMVSISIEKEHRGSHDENNDSWIIRLALDLPELGPLQIRISHFKQGVSTCFWSESTKARFLIESQLDRLKSNLAQHGIKSLNIFCQDGSPVTPLSPGADTSSMDLLV